MSLFKGVGDAKFGGKDPTFNPEREYLVRLDSIEQFESKQTPGTFYFKARTQILQSTDPQRRAGTYAIHMVTLKPADRNSFPLALGDVKQIATAVYRGVVRKGGSDPDKEVDPDAFTEAEIEALCTPDQPGAGIICGIRTSAPHKTKKGGEFTTHFWQDGTEFVFSQEVTSSIPFEWNGQKQAA